METLDGRNEGDDTVTMPSGLSRLPINLGPPADLVRGAHDFDAGHHLHLVTDGYRILTLGFLQPRNDPARVQQPRQVAPDLEPARLAGGRAETACQESERPQGSSEGGVTAFSGGDPYGIFQGQDEQLPVPGLPGMGDIGDLLDNPSDLVLRDGNHHTAPLHEVLQVLLRQVVRLPLLPPEAPAFEDGHPGKITQLLDRVDQLGDLELTDYRHDQFHVGLPQNSTRRRSKAP